MDVDKEEENFYRVVKLVHDEFAKELRPFFKTKWKEKFSPWENTIDNGNELWKKLSGKKPRKDIEKKLKAGNCEDWDCTCLLQAICFSRLDIKSEEPHLNKLRKIRNDIDHLPAAKLSTDGTKDIFDNVKKVYISLKWDIKTVERIEKEGMRTEDIKRLEKQLLAEKKAALRENQEDLLTLPEKIKNFIGREKEMEKFVGKLGISSLDDTEDDVDKNFVIIQGGPCCGKTSLAIMLGYELSEKYNYVIWINMRDLQNSDNPTLEAVAMKILQEFKIDTSEMKDEIVSCLNQKLENITASGKKALLIFDNADALALIQPSCLSTLQSTTFTELKRLIANNSRKSIKAIFTVRSCILTGDDVYTEKIDNLKDDDSKRLLEAELNNKNDDEKTVVVNQLAEICRGLPFALKICASVVNRMNDSLMIEDYLNDLQQSPVDTIYEEYPEITHLFEASFKYLKPKELDLLQMLAVFPSGFSYDYVKKLSSTLHLKARLLDSIKQHGLVNREIENYIMHPFLSDYLRKRWKNEEKEQYLKTYYTLYLQRLFELSSDSLSKDQYAKCLEEFKTEQNNFDFVMNEIGVGFHQDEQKTIITRYLPELLDRCTSEYVASIHFLIDLVHHQLLVNFYGGCAKFAFDQKKPNIICCHYEVTMKLYQKATVDAPQYNHLDDYGKALFDKRRLSRKIHEASLRNYVNDLFKLQWSDLEDYETRVKNLENDKLGAYFLHKILKLKTMALKKADSHFWNRNKVIKLHLESLEIAKRTFGSNWLTIDCYNQLAKSYWKYSMNDEALKMFEESEKVAEEISVTKNKKFGSILLDKGRFLMESKEENLVDQGKGLLQQLLGQIKDDSDTKYWCSAMKSLYPADNSYREEIMKYFKSHSRPSHPLFSLITVKFKHELSELSKEFDESIALSKGKQMVDDLNEAINHMQEIRESLDQEYKIDQTFIIFLFIWYMKIALKCGSVLPRSERKIYAEKALQLKKEYDSWIDNNERIKELERIVEGFQDSSDETLLRKKDYLDSISKDMISEGKKEELKKRYISLLEESEKFEGNQVLWTSVVLRQGKTFPVLYDRIPQYLADQENPSLELLRLVTRKFLYEMDIIKRSSDESEIERKLKTATDDLREAALYVHSLAKDQPNKNFTESLLIWYKFLALNTDHILNQNDRVEFAKSALALSHTSNDIIKENDKETLGKLKNSRVVSSTEQEMQTKKAMLIRVTPFLKGNGEHKELEKRYLRFLKSCKNYAKIQFNLIKWIITKENVPVERYFEFLQFLPEQFERELLSGGWDFQFIIDTANQVLENQPTQQSRIQGLNVCERIYAVLSSKRASFSLNLQKKLEFHFLIILSLETGFSPQWKERESARKAMEILDRYNVCDNDRDRKIYNRELSRCLES